jgi:hydroxyacyl-ACP dehydratase HTD2-like protein with hotdog domain
MKIRLDRIEVGTAVPPLVWKPTHEQLFRFSAVTWNPHRIHYDREAAIAEGHPDILVQAHLHGAVLNRMLTDWIGPRGKVRSLSWQNRSIATPADTLTCSATVVKKVLEDMHCTLWLDLGVTADSDRLCVSGSAVVDIPTDEAAGLAIAAS